VVAADYIRNLREETIKGLRGRLKQGLYPWGAPIGYLDTGGGNRKEIDPVKGPLVRELFEKYATGEYTLKSLLQFAKQRGLTNRYNKPISMTGLSTILNNPFYTGIIYIKRMNETFPGKHEPIIDQDTFNTVERVLSGKTTKGNGKHDHSFRRMISCSGCMRSLIGERQKGRVYYRCHQCKGVSIREDSIEESIASVLSPFQLCEHELAEVEAVRKEISENDREILQAEKSALTIERQSLETRLSVLTDALLDGTIDKELFLIKKKQLVSQIQVVREKLSTISGGMSKKQLVIDKHLELYKTAYLNYENGNPSQRRKLLREITSNRLAHGKNLEIELFSPFKELCEAKKASSCAHCQGWSRTFSGEDKRKKSFTEVLRGYLKHL
jgi:hypothetical protein